MVEHGGHHAHGQPAQTELPQCIEERLQLRLVLLNDAIRLVLLPRHQDLAGEAQKEAVVIA
jgi:hypothetical protein